MVCIEIFCTEFLSSCNFFIHKNWHQTMIARNEMQLLYVLAQCAHLHKKNVANRIVDNYTIIICFTLTLSETLFFLMRSNLLCWFCFNSLINFRCKNKMIEQEYCQTKQEATKHDTKKISTLWRGAFHPLQF